MVDRQPEILAYAEAVADQFDLRPAVEGLPGLSSADLANGRPKLVNVFASWCIPCRVEAPQLEALRACALRKLLQRAHFGAARSAPARPEVEQYYFSFQ